MKKLETVRLSYFSILKLLFIGLLIPLFLFGLVCGMTAFFGYDTVTLNGANVYGFKGLATGMILGIILPTAFALLFSLIMGLGLWVYSKFFTLLISYKGPDC